MKEEIKNIEIQLLLEGIYRIYGYDFRNYSLASLKRRLKRRMVAEGVDTISGLQEIIFHHPESMQNLFYDLSINVTEFFRNPPFYKIFRQKVLPVLNTYPFIRIWHAGCSTGEEVYSMAILLEEEKLYDRCKIYATDMNERVIKQAKQGIFKLDAMKKYTRNYHFAGGKDEFSKYYTAHYNNAQFNSSLKKNVVFAQHNLVTDSSFNEFNVILCMNVMIYFNKNLQENVIDLLDNSLCNFGILCIGEKENLNFSSFNFKYKPLDDHQRIYQKIK
ncbi:protein-glutamate O-methyltransferase CheR [Candidatus Magnetomorum sp. HK-1]|nr:protein-glutamate O-methyltransferase CheR [Candidatus Magnetomorum sp. HK-1]